MKKMKKIALHWKILIGMVLGFLVGYTLTNMGYVQFVKDWIGPFGTIFIGLLKMIAIPLIIASLVKGISDLEDISKFSRMGIRTIILYVLTTIVAISIGLALVNIVNPGSYISEETLSELVAENSETAEGKIQNAKAQGEAGPLQPLVDIVPENIFHSMSENGLMLQVIFFVILLGICMILIDKEKAKPLKNIFDALNDIIMKMVDLIMLIAPVGVFALMAKLVAETSRPDLIFSLIVYGLTVVVGLALMIVFYLIVVFFYTGRSPMDFLKGISPAQLVAFSTSSSAATLPVTMERVEEHLGVDEEVSSFVLPVGATINMDGTSLYQAVAAVFICQALNVELTMGMILTILLTALLASIGSAAVPGAGVIMLIIVLESINFPSELLEKGIVMILAVDRPLDMCRTMVNVTGDATVSMVVAKSTGQLGEPNPKNLKDHYKN